MLFRRRSQGDETDPDLRIVVGLGNPGREYARTRHNVGFDVAVYLAGQNSMTFKGSKLRADVARGRIAGLPVLMALPVTYMNESGNAVSRILSYYRAPVENLLVVCDEIDLPFGTLRLRPQGSSAGHRGLRSIEQALDTREFARLRFGVGRPRGDAVPHVLGRFPAEQERVLPELVRIAADAVVVTLREGIEVAMNRFNRDWLPEVSGPVKAE